MRRIEVTEFGGPEVLVVREAPDPEPGPGQVRVDVEIVEIIFLDTQLRSGWGRDFFPMRPPWVPGTGIAGRIGAVGVGVDPARVGQRVVARTGDGGAYAERVAVDAAEARSVPDELALDLATAALHDGVLAQQQLEAAALRPGDRVLITAAAGSVGHWLVPLARAAGATVVGAAGGAAKVRAVCDLGADAAVDYLADDWSASVRAALADADADADAGTDAGTDADAGTDGVVDAVFDGAGGAIGRTALGLLRPGGVFLGYGAASGDFGARGGRDDVTIIGLDASQGDVDRHLRTGLRLLADGAVRPVIGQRVPFEHAALAHRAIADRTVVGKSVLIV